MTSPPRIGCRRNDAESLNRGIEDSLFINRAFGKGWRRQMVDLLGHARLVNALTLACCRARLPVEAVARCHSIGIRSPIAPQTRCMPVEVLVDLQPGAADPF